MSAVTGMVSIVLFLPCIFNETKDQVMADGNAGDDTTETLNIAEAEPHLGTRCHLHTRQSGLRPEKKGMPKRK